MYEWQVCSYVGKYNEHFHLIDGYVWWHDWSDCLAKPRAERVWYSFVWDEYYCVYTKEISPVIKKDKPL